MHDFPLKSGSQMARHTSVEFSQANMQPCQPSDSILIITVCVSQVCSALASHPENKHLDLTGITVETLWPNKCSILKVLMQRKQHGGWWI